MNLVSDSFRRGGLEPACGPGINKAIMQNRVVDARNSLVDMVLYDKLGLEHQVRYVLCAKNAIFRNC